MWLCSWKRHKSYQTPNTHLITSLNGSFLDLFKIQWKHTWGALDPFALLQMKQKKKRSKSVLFAVENNMKITCVLATQTWFQGLCYTFHTKVLGVICSCFYLVARVLLVIAYPSLYSEISLIQTKVQWDFSCLFYLWGEKKKQGKLFGKVIPLFSSHKILDIIHVYIPNGKTWTQPFNL